DGVFITTHPQKFELTGLAELNSIDFRLTTPSVAEGARILLSLEFKERIDFELHWPWQAMTSTSIVAGHRLSYDLQERFILQLPSRFPAPSAISIWHSKHQTAPVELTYLVVESA